MANYCDYEIHVRGSKKAALFLYTMMPALDYKEITHEEGTDEEYIVWMTGNCKWSLDRYCEEKQNVVIDLDSFSEDDVRDEEVGLNYWYLTMRQKSEVLGVEILAHSWSDESEFDQFDHYLNGKLLSSEADEYNAYPAYEDVEDEFESYKDYCEAFDVDPNVAPPVWDKNEFETYEKFCQEYGIDPTRLPEDAWYEDDENIFYCDIESEEHISRFTFEF